MMLPTDICPEDDGALGAIKRNDRPPGHPKTYHVIRISSNQALVRRR